jgi:5-methylcytosine-specific restriction endonuclease McrA
MKKCSKCKIEKDENEFNKNKSKKDGLSTECKLCKRQQDAKWREEALAKNPNYNKEYQVQYRKENFIALNAKKKIYVEDNKTAHLKRQNIWYEKNKDSVKNRISLYKKEHPEQYQMYNNRRAARKKTSIIEIFTHQDIINRYGNQCFYCGELFTHIDHYMPLSRGGAHTLENVRPSCAHCNLTKSNKLPEEFIKYKKEYK